MLNQMVFEAFPSGGSGLSLLSSYDLCGPTGLEFNIVRVNTGHSDIGPIAKEIDIPDLAFSNSFSCRLRPNVADTLFL